MAKLTTVNGLTFIEFMERVNSKLGSLTHGMEATDLPDYCYLDCWRNGMNAVETAKEAFQYAQDY